MLNNAKCHFHILDYKLSRSLLHIPPHIRLTDAQFDVPYDVDMIIGNGYFWDIMSAGHHRLGPGLSVLLKTQMGWVLGESVRSTTASQRRIRNVVTNKPLNDQLTRFWVIETIPETNESYTQSYEGYFMQMITRNFGRHLIVEISLNYDITKSGENRFRNLDRKLSTPPSAGICLFKNIPRWDIRINYQGIVQSRRNPSITCRIMLSSRKRVP